MPTKEIVEYFLKLGGDFAKDAKEAAGATEGLSGKAQAATFVVGSLATAAIAAGGSFAALASEVFGTVDQINTLAQASGLTTDTVAGLRLAARNANKELEQLVPRDLAQKMWDAAHGSADAVESFRLLGVTVKDTSGHLRSTDAVLAEAIEGLFAIEDPAVRANVAMRAMGEAGKQLLSAFASREDFERFVEGAKEFGIHARVAQEQSDAWWKATANLKLAIEDTGAAFVSAFGDGATNWVNNIALGTVYLTALLEGLAEVAKVAGQEVVDSLQQIADHIRGEQSKAAENGKVALGEFGKAALKHAPQEVTPTHIKTADEIGDTIGEALQKAMDGALERAKTFYTTFLAGAGGLPDGAGDGRNPVVAAAAPLKGDVFAELLAKGNYQAEAAGMAAIDRVVAVWEAGTEESNAATFALIDELQAEQEALDRLGQSVGVMDQSLRQTQAESAAATRGLITATINTATEILSLPTMLLGVVRELPSMLASAVVDTSALYLEIPEAIETIVTQLPKTLVDAAPDMALAFVLMGPKIAIAFLEGFVGLFSVDFWKDAGRSIGQAFVDAAGDLLNPFSKDGALGTDLKAAKGEKTFLGLKLPSFDVARSHPHTITQTGLALVHAGEEIGAAGRRAGGGIVLNIGQVVTPDPERFIREVEKYLGNLGGGGTLEGRP